MRNWDFLQQKYEADRLAHAYILLGGNGEDKRNLVEKFTQHLNCKFPDFLTVKKQEDKHHIVIDQIKKVQAFLQYKSYYGGYKVIFIEDADAMNFEAQNSFLKTLEEPSQKSLIFLSAEKLDFILPTVSSRCQVLHFLESKKSAISPVHEKELSELLLVLDANLAEKFKYAKNIDGDGKSVKNILTLIEWYFRKLLLEYLEEKTGSYSYIKIRNILEVIDRVNKKLIFTNVSQKLALEVLLMEINAQK